MGKRGVEEQMVVLQQQTLTAVNAWVDIQQQLLEVKKEKIIMKKIKLTLYKAVAIYLPV